MKQNTSLKSLVSLDRQAQNLYKRLNTYYGAHYNFVSIDRRARLSRAKERAFERWWRRTEALMAARSF
jgi:hypothetical protein